MKTKEKPAWWPKNPYPEDIFPMKREDYPKIVPDDNVRTALTGCLGRIFWEMASDCIWDKFLEAAENGLAQIMVELKEPIKVWRFNDAPKEYQELSDHGGDEDWLVFVPEWYRYHDTGWMDESGPFGYCRVSQHEVPGGTVHIGAHA